MCAWTNGWDNIRDAGDLRHHGAHCDAIVMAWKVIIYLQFPPSQKNRIHMNRSSPSIPSHPSECHRTSPFMVWVNLLTYIHLFSSPCFTLSSSYMSTIHQLSGTLPMTSAISSSDKPRTTRGKAPQIGPLGATVITSFTLNSFNGILMGTFWTVKNTYWAENNTCENNFIRIETSYFSFVFLSLQLFFVPNFDNIWNVNFLEGTPKILIYFPDSWED